MLIITLLHTYDVIYINSNISHKEVYLLTLDLNLRGKTVCLTYNEGYGESVSSYLSLARTLRDERIQHEEGEAVCAARPYRVVVYSVHALSCDGDILK